MIAILSFGLGCCAGAGAFAWAFEIRRAARIARRVARARGREIAKLHARAARARRSKRKRRPAIRVSPVSSAVSLEPLPACPAIHDGLVCAGHGFPARDGLRCDACGLEWR